MAGRADRQTGSAVMWLQPHVAHRAEHVVGALLHDRLIQMPEDAARLSLLQRHGSQRVTSEAGDDGCLHPFPADISDDQGPRPVSRVERVVEVPSDLVALAAPPVPAFDLQPWDLRQHGGKETLLQPSGHPTDLLEEPGVVHGQCGSPSHLLGEDEVALVVPAARFRRDQGDGPQRAAPGHHGNDDRRSDSQALHDLQEHRIWSGLLDEGLRDLGKHLGPSRAQHPGHPGGGQGVGWITLPELLCQLHLVRVDVSNGQLADGAVGFEHVDRAPVGDLRDDELGHSRQGLLVSLDGCGHQRTRLGQEMLGLLHPLALRDVCNHARHGHDRTRFILYAKASAVDPTDGAIGPDHPMLDLEVRAGLAGPLDRGRDPVALIGMESLPVILERAPESTSGEPEDLLERLIPRHGPGGDVVMPGAEPACLQGEAQALPALAKPLLRRSPPSDVAYETGEHRRAENVHARHRELDGELGAVCPQRCELEALAQERSLPSGQETSQAGPVSFPQERRHDELGHLLAYRLVPEVPEGLLGRGIELEDLALVVDRDDAVQSGFHDGGLPGLTLENSLLGPLAFHELADLAADHRERHEEIGVRLLDLAAEEIEGAQDPLPEEDRKTKASADPLPVGTARSREVVVFRHVGDPGGAAGRPHPARKPDPRRKERLATHPFELDGIGTGRMPHVDASNDLGLLVDPPQCPDRPPQVLANRLEDHRDGLGEGRGFGQSPSHTGPGSDESLRSHPVGDVHRHADEAIMGVVSVSVDITDRVRTERLIAARTGVTRALAEASSLTEAVPMILQAVCENLGWAIGTLWRVDQGAEVIRCVDVWHAPGADAVEFERVSRQSLFPPGVGLPGRVWSTGRSAWIPDVTKDDNFPRARSADREGIRGGFGFPILLGEEVLGALEFFSREIQEPDADLLLALSVIGSQIGQFMERKGAEQAVLQSEARKSAIVEAALDCIITIDHEGKVLEFNPAAEKTFGYLRDEAIGKEMAELIVPPLLRERHRAGLARFLATGEGPLLGKRFEFTALRADGTEFPIELTVARVDILGPPMFTGFVRDITRRRAAEERLRESRERLRLALEAGRLGTWHYDIPTGAVTWDETLEEIFGLPRGTFGGTFQDYRERLHPDERDRITATVEGARESGSDFEIEHRVIWPDGSIRWIDGRGLCIKDEAGAVVAMTGVGADITERKRVEQAQHFLAEAGPLMAASIEGHAQPFARAAQLVVPQIADWCSIDMLEPDGSIRQLAVAHVDPDT